jgi:UDP-3-O-[3-hydroxymyristoyl] glucosamine N-acyltransferase
MNAGSDSANGATASAANGFTAGELAAKVGAEVIGDSSVRLTGFAPAAQAKPGDLTFAENERFFSKAELSPASAILVDGDFKSEKKVLLRVPNARIAFAKVLPYFHPETRFPQGIHPTAVVAPSAVIDPSAYVGPHCFVDADCKIGPRVVLQSGNHVGAGSVLGEDCHLFPNVVLYPRTQMGQRVRIHAGSVIGSDGFGYVLDGGAHRKVPQAGNVIIQDDVEIGANVTVDRGALGPTLIGRGTKIDNLVQIAHNVTIGEHCLLVAQAGVAGSTKLGNYVILAGQVGLAGHLKIGNKAVIAAQSGVMHDVPEGEKWFGTPAKKDRQMKRQLIMMEQLPRLLARISELEKRLEEMEKSAAGTPVSGH